MRLKNEILTKALSAVRILFSGSTKTYVAKDAHATGKIKNDYLNLRRTLKKELNNHKYLG